MKKRNLIIQIIACALAMLFIPGCTGTTPTPTAPAEPDSTAAQEELRSDIEVAATGTATPVIDRNTLKVALSKNPSSLDPNEGNIQTFLITNNILEHLCITDSNGQTIPFLATSWEQVDELTWRFVLREDVTFSNGDKFNAESVAYTINYLGTKEPKFKYATKWGKPSWPISAEVESEYVVLIKTPVPNMTVPEQMTFISMLPVGAGEMEGFAENPIGTGPYTLTKSEVGVTYTVELRDSYWGEMPTIKTIIFDVVADESARMAALRNGEYDFVQNVSYDVATELKNNEIEGMSLEQQYSNGMYYIYFNGLSENKFIQDPEFRKALTYAIDYAAIEEILCENYVLTNRGICPIVDNINYAYESEGYPERDIEKAKELAEACGYDGTEIVMYYSNAQFIRDLEISEAIMSMLEEAGFNTRIEQIDSASWSEYKQTGKYDLALNAASGTYTQDPEYYYVQSLGSSGFWAWDETESLLAKCYESGITAEKRGEYLYELTKYAWEMTPMIWAAEPVLMNAYDSGLDGVFSTPVSLIWFTGAKWN